MSDSFKSFKISKYYQQNIKITLKFMIIFLKNILEKKLFWLKSVF